MTLGVSQFLQLTGPRRNGRVLQQPQPPTRSTLPSSLCPADVEGSRDRRGAAGYGEPMGDRCGLAARYGVPRGDIAGPAAWSRPNRNARHDFFPSTVEVGDADRSVLSPIPGAAHVTTVGC